MTILWLFAHPYVIPNLSDFLLDILQPAGVQWSSDYIDFYYMDKWTNGQKKRHIGLEQHEDEWMITKCRFLTAHFNIKV